MFVLITILFIPKLIGTKILIVVLIYLLFLRKIYSLRSSKKIIQKLFDSGFWLGVLCILEPFSILFFVLIIASVLLQQKITIHTLITPIIGFSSPLFIYFSYLFWCGTTDLFLQIFYLNKISYLFIYAKDATIWIFGIIIILAIISIFLKSPSALSVNNSFKKSWILLFFNLVIATFFGLTIPEKNGSEVFFLMIPASIIIANGLEEIEKNKVKDYVFLFFLIGTFITFFLL